MAEVDNNKPKTEKTSACVTSTLPKLWPATKIDNKDISCNIPKLKRLPLGSRLVSNEKKNRFGFVIHTKTNLYKSKLTEIKNSDKGLTSNCSLIFIPIKGYHGHIPIFHRHSSNFIRMTPPVTRSSSPFRKGSAKDIKPSNKVKTITLNESAKKKTNTSCSRSPSPAKRIASSNYRKSKPILLSPKSSDKTTGAKRSDSSKITSPRKYARAKSKTNVSSLSYAMFQSKKGSTKDSQLTCESSDAPVLKRLSQPSLLKKEKFTPAQEKVSLDRLNNERHTGDHRRLSFEKVHLCIEKSVENLNPGERKESFLVTYSKEDLKNQEEISLAFLQNLSSSSITTFSKDSDVRRAQENASDSKAAIRTLSGHELILTPSMKLAMEKTDFGSEDIEISELLHESGEHFDDQKDVHIFQDDANEYDSEVSTDGEVARKEQPKRLVAARPSGTKCGDMHRKSASALWKSREADLLNDVDYRQSVYHPAVSRRQTDDFAEMDFKPKSKSIEDNYGFGKKSSTERIIRSRSSNLRNKYSAQNFMTCKSNVGVNERSWGSSFDKTDGKQIYNPVIQDVPLYGPLRGMKRIKTKKERVSGAFLRFTLKIIRLLALFNVWPGDNCHMLTSQSLRLAR